MMAELNCCDRDHMPHKPENSYCLTLYRESLLTFGLECNFALNIFYLGSKSKTLNASLCYHVSKKDHTFVTTHRE